MSFLCPKPTDRDGKVGYTGSQPGTSTTGTSVLPTHDSWGRMPRKPVESLQIPKMEFWTGNTQRRKELRGRAGSMDIKGMSNFLT